MEQSTQIIMMSYAYAVYASDIDSTLPLELDSLELISITLIESSSPDVNYLPEELGLEIVCNNNGDSGSPSHLSEINIVLLFWFQIL